MAPSTTPSATFHLKKSTARVFYPFFYLELNKNPVEDLIGKRVGLVNGYSYTPSFWEFVKMHRLYELVASDVSNFKKLNGGNLDFVLAEKRNGGDIINQLCFDTIVSLNHNPVKTDGLYIIFNKREVSKAFVDTFSNTVRKFKKEPAYQSLHQRYLAPTRK